MYAVLLSYASRPDLRLLDRAHQTVMGHQQRAIQSLGIDCSIQGICDLTLDEKKFSGNSLRCRRNFLLYHGTILYGFPLSLLGTCLGSPQRQPDYRQQRSHLEFVTNIEASRGEIIQALRGVWDAGDETATWPELMTSRLAAEKYSRLEWTSRH
jgi:lipoate-protein ligase A